MSGDTTEPASEERPCLCRCHVSSGTHRSCDVDGGHEVGCGPHAVHAAHACVMAHAPEPIESTDGLLCRRHYHWIDRTLTQIEELYALLDDVLIPGPGGDGRSATRVGSPAPGRVEVMALTDKRGERDWIGDDDAIPDVLGALYTWVRTVAEERDDDQIGQVGGISQVIGRLRKWRQWIARQPWVDDYAADLAALHRHVARGAGDTMWPKPIGKCPNCTVPLYNTIGLDVVTCRKCRASWTGPALARLRLIHEQEAAS